MLTGSRSAGLLEMSRMRVSEAGLAVITRVVAQGNTEYLTQWNDKWRTYALIGGHREVGESFRDCCIREIEEELGLQREVDFKVAAVPLGPRLEYTDHSGSTQVTTKYIFEFFETILEKQVSIDPNNCWIRIDEALSGRAENGCVIAEQVRRAILHNRCG